MAVLVVVKSCFGVIVFLLGFSRFRVVSRVPLESRFYLLWTLFGFAGVCDDVTATG